MRNKYLSVGHRQSEGHTEFRIQNANENNSCVSSDTEKIL